MLPSSKSPGVDRKRFQIPSFLVFLALFPAGDDRDSMIETMPISILMLYAGILVNALRFRTPGHTVLPKGQKSVLFSGPSGTNHTFRGRWRFEGWDPFFKSALSQPSGKQRKHEEAN